MVCWLGIQLCHCDGVAGSRAGVTAAQFWEGRGFHWVWNGKHRGVFAGREVSPFIPSLFPMLIHGCSTPGKELIYFCALPKRGDNTPHVGSAAPIISWQSRKVLIVSNGASMLHPGVKNSVLPCSKFSKAFTINAQFLAMPLG